MARVTELRCDVCLGRPLADIDLLATGRFAPEADVPTGMQLTPERTWRTPSSYAFRASVVTFGIARYSTNAASPVLGRGQ